MVGLSRNLDKQYLQTKKLLLMATYYNDYYQIY